MKKILFLSLVTAAYAVAGSSQLFSTTQAEVNSALKEIRAIMIEKGLRTEEDFGQILDLGEILVDTKEDIEVRADEYTSLKVKAGSGQMELIAPCLVKFRPDYAEGTDEIDPEIMSLVKIKK